MTIPQKQATENPFIFHQTAYEESFPAGQCDCSWIPMFSPPTPPITVDNAEYILCKPFLSFPLTQDHYITLGSHSGPVILNRSALSLAEQFCQTNSLEPLNSCWQKDWTDENVHVILSEMIKYGLIVPEIAVDSAVVENSERLTAWLHITEHCNLRCTYCYLPHRYAEMSVDIGKASIEATFRSALIYNYQEVTLKYAGGEPLLHFELIPVLHRHAKVLADLHDLSLHGIILTNGTLLSPGIVKQIQALDLKIMISLDGLQNFHNCQRPYADGNGSFDAVVKGIDLVVAHGLVPDISITVTDRNVEGLPELISWVLDRELPFSLRFCRTHPLSLSETDLHLKEENIIAGMLAAYKVIESALPPYRMLGSLIDHANFAVPHLRTCSVGNSYIVYDCQGRVAKCQMDINTSVTDVYAPDPLGCIKGSHNGIQNISVEEKIECSECRWRYWCTGGCPLSTYLTTGRYDLKSPNCNIYKALYPEVIRLEGLRLLRRSQEPKS